MMRIPERGSQKNLKISERQITYTNRSNSLNETTSHKAIHDLNHYSINNFKDTLFSNFLYIYCLKESTVINYYLLKSNVMQMFSMRRTVLFSITLLTCVGRASYSQSFSNNNVTSIPDKGSVSIPIVVTGLASAVDTVNFGLESITLNIVHNADQELTLQLQSPDGTTVLLANNLPGSNYTNTIFDGSSNIYIDFGTAPYTSNYRSIQDLSYLNNSQNPNGTWDLIVTDNAIGSIGTVQGVSFNFSDHPAKPLLSSSNLPIIKINTNGQQIVDDPKIVADMAIIYNGPGKTNNVDQTNYNYLGKIGIEFRGHSSQMFPKKQFGFETRDETGIDDSDVSLLGLPKESDWILSANYSDKSLMRNILSYQLSREMGNYASRTINCEVIINNEYKGVFVLMEKLKRDKNRVNVEKIASTDITPPNVTGGYIFSIDKLDGGETTWTSKIAPAPGYAATVFQFVYPKDSEDIQPQQKEYLSDYVDSFEEALNGSKYQDPVNGFSNFADGTSFMDFFIVNELARNIDGFRLSSYFHKSRQGKIVAGPVWDFDIAWGNANYYSGSNPVGFDYTIAIPPNDYQVPFWWERLMTDVAWKAALNCRYSDFRQNVLSQQRIYTIIDSVSNELQIAQTRNFIRWNIMGQYVWPNPQPVPTSYAGEVSNLKNWVTARLNFLDGELGGCGGALPVTLLSFEGVQTKNINKLTWTTTNEINNKTFLIERSANNQPFIQIGIVNGNGSNSTTNNYSFDDKDPQVGINLYRLKQIDYDGNFSYSKIISLGNKINDWVISPNLVGSQLTIISPYTDNQPLKLYIYNMQGSRVKSDDVNNAGIIRQNVATLSKGVYIVQIIDSEGNSTSLRFIKE